MDVVLSAEEVSDDELEIAETKRVLFAEGQADRGTKVGVESVVDDALVVVVDLMDVVVVGDEAAIVRTPADCDDVDVTDCLESELVQVVYGKKEHTHELWSLAKA